MKAKRKLIRLLLVLLFCISYVTLPVSAESYPSIFPQKYTISVKKGETANLKFEIFRKYNNEKYHVNIYKGTLEDIDNGRAELVSTAERSVVSTSTVVDVTLPWDTSDVEPGLYTAEYYMSFYTFYQWRETPNRKRLLTITVEDSKASETSTQQEIKVTLNGSKIRFDQPPIIEKGRTLVPLRAIFEALGAKVNWDDNTQIVTAIKNSKTVSLKIGSTDLNIDGIIKILDVPAKLIGGRTLVPVRAISEAFGCSVEWDSNTQTVIIKQ